MNNVVLTGRLTKDPEPRSIMTANGEMQAVNFILAVDRKIKKDEQNSADFIRCQAFSKTAEAICKYLHKGSKICIRGHIQTGSYEKQDGTKVYTTDVIVDHMEFLDSKASDTSKQGNNEDENPFASDPLEDEGLPFR